MSRGQFGSAVRAANAARAVSGGGTFRNAVRNARAANPGGAGRGTFRNAARKSSDRVPARDAFGRIKPAEKIARQWWSKSK